MAVAVVGLVLCASPATGAPSNGRIAFEDELAAPTTLRLVSPDGSGNVALLPPGDAGREPAWSPDGTQVAFVGTLDGQDDLWLTGMAPGSRPVQLTDDPAPDADPAWSPDGTQIAFSSRRDSTAQLYVLDVATRAVQQLTFDTSNDSQPAWSANDELAFVSDRRGKPDIYVTAPTPGAPVTQLTSNELPDSEPAWSPDGSLLAFSRGPQDATHLFVVDAGGGLAARLTAAVPAERSPAWAPDGSAMAYIRRRGAVDQLVVAPVRGTQLTGRTTVVTSGAARPDWGALPAAPVPTPGQTVSISRAGGTVTAIPGADSAATRRVASAVAAPAQLPVGPAVTSTVDATSGVAVVQGATTVGAAQQPVARLVGARAEVTQPTPSARLALRFVGAAPACSATAAQRRPRRRTPRAVMRGRAKVQGRFSLAAAEGTRWTSAETCAGTVTLVRSGTVTVTDRTGRSVRVRAPGCRVVGRRRVPDRQRRRACAAVRALAG